MAKLTLNDLANLGGNPSSAQATLNSNNDALQAAFDNTLSRDGSGPNQMEADIDLNSNDLLNVQSIDAKQYMRNGVPFEQSVAYGNKLYQLFSGTGAQTTFTLLRDPASLGNLDVAIAGVTQRPGLDYTYTGTALTFSTAPAVGTDNIVVRFDEAVPVGSTIADSVVYSDPAPGVPVLLKTTQEILDGLPVSIMRFIPRGQHSAIFAETSGYDVSASFQDAFDAASPTRGIHLLVPQGLFNIPTVVTTSASKIRLFGSGKPRLVLAAGQSAGYIPFAIYNSGFEAHDLSITSATRSHCFYIQPQEAAALLDFSFTGLQGNGLFYMVRGDGASDRKIKNVLVQGCYNIAPVGQNSGHFFVDWGEDIRYIGNSIVNGYNTSGYGVADSTNIIIVGNTERDLQDTASVTEAACQIEDSAAANAVISGNSFEHDIWIAGSSGVTISGNACRRMRVSVGNADGHDVRDVLFSGNKAASIHIANFSGGTPPERISARFLNNTLDPDGKTVNGTEIAQLVYGEGSYITELELRGNRAITDATTNALQITRASGANYRFYDNDFGTLAHSVTSSGGRIYERGNRNRVKDSYVSVSLTSTFAISAGAWQTTVYNSEQDDINSEYSTSTGEFTPLESGTYIFHGHHTVDPDAAGSQMGIRLWNATDSAEIRRLAFPRAVDASSWGQPFYSGEVSLIAGKAYRIEHFLTGATTQFVTGTTLTFLEIVRVD